MKLKKLIVVIFIFNLSSNTILLIKIPTRQRPIQFFKVLDKYYQNLSGEYNYTFLISCDLDDITMNNQDVISRLKTYTHLYYYFGDNKTKIEAYNADINKHLDFDILLVTSDDTDPSKNYDKKIINLMLKYFPDFDGVMNFNDGHVKDNLNTFPVIGKKYYDRFGFIYNPVYKSMYCDTEFTEISKILKKEFYSNEIIIEHIHPAWYPQIGYDDLYQKNYIPYEKDKLTFEKRKKENFGLNK